VKIKSGRLTGWQAAVIAGLGLALAAYVFSLFANWAYDDPYITYRYARNLASGQGFVYNPGERVLSTTTPLFTLLLALAYRFTSDLPHLANLVSALSLAAGGLLLWDLSRSWNTPLAGWAMLFLYPLFPLVVTTTGSETPLYLALCIGAFAAYARQRYILTACLAALATLARPDAILVALILGVDYALRRWRSRAGKTDPSYSQERFPWEALVVFWAILGAWGLFAAIYFGNPLPVTLGAKQAQGVLEISTTFAPGLLSKVLLVYGSNPLYWVLSGFAVLGAAWAALRRSRWWLFAVWPVLYFLAYTLLGVSSYYWYYAPLVPGFIALAGLGVEAVARFAGRIGERAPGLQPEHTARWATAALLFVLVPWQAYTLYRASQFADSRLGAYQATGNWLAANTLPGERVGMLEIGIIGYYANRPVVDFAGLLQPQVAAQMAPTTTYLDTAAWAIDHYQPELLVLHAGFFPETAAPLQNCEVVYTVNGKPFDYNSDLVIYRCHSVELSLNSLNEMR
jgi:hypothetical protein